MSDVPNVGCASCPMSVRQAAVPHACLQEILRHFYACVGPPLTAAARPRLAKLQAAALQLHGELGELKARLPRGQADGGFSEAVLRRVSPMLYLLQIALDKYAALGLSG